MTVRTGEGQKVADAVGLIGIGLMGTALARRLLDAGYPVVGFDVAAARRDELRRMGGEPVELDGGSRAPL